MADIYTQLANTPVGRVLTRQVGLPAPVPLRRDGDGDAERPARGSVLFAAAPGGRLEAQIVQVLADAGAPLARLGTENARHRYRQALIFDATGIVDTQGLQELQAFFSASIRALEPCGRVVVLGSPPADASAPSEAIAQRALEGFTRSLGKELRRGDRSAGLRRAGRRARAGVDASLPALTALGLRVRPGRARWARRPARRAGLGASSAGQGRAGHGRIPRHRRLDRGDARARRRARRRPRSAGLGR